MLLWKEWRQQRWTFLGMSALALALFVLGGFVAGRWSFGLSGAAYVFALLGVPLVLSARAFAGEDDDGTATFLRELPFRPLQVFAAKFLVVVLASWAAAGLLLALGWLWSSYPDNALGSVFWATRALPERGSTAVLGGIWLVAPTAAALASLLASLGLRSLTTALLSGVCLCPCACCGALSAYLLGVLQARGFMWAGVAGSVSLAGLVLSARLSARRHPRRPLQLVRGVGGSAAVAVLFLLPAVLAVLYLAVLARPEAYVRPTWWRARLAWFSATVPPTDRPAAVLLTCTLRRSDAVSLAVVESSQGGAAWTDMRLISPYFHGDRAAWSPDGTRLAGLDWAKPGTAGAIEWLCGIRGHEERQDRSVDDAHLFVLDTRTRRTTYIPGELPCTWLLEGGGLWYDPTWLAGYQGRNQAADPGPLGIGFLNVEDGTTRVCRLSSSDDSTRWQAWAGNRVVLAGRAVFAPVWRQAPSGAGRELAIARCRPSDAVATLVQVGDPRPRGRLADVSPDERWALFVFWEVGGQTQHLDLVDLGTGATRRVTLPDEFGQHETEGRIGQRVVGFVVGGRRLAVSTCDAHALLDLTRDSWEVRVPPTPDGPQASAGMWHASPNGARLLQYYYPGCGASVARIFDADSGQWTTLSVGKCDGRLQWFGNEHLLAQNDEGLCKLGLDGSRELLWPRE
jgi:hypothetical protein